MKTHCAVAMCLATCALPQWGNAATIVDTTTGLDGSTIVDVTPNTGITQTTIFPEGFISFADEVVSYSPGDGFSGNPQCKDASQILGVPDYSASGDCAPLSANAPPSSGFDTGSGFVSLGHLGSITVRFTDNSLVASGNSDLDLFIFEIGQAFEPVSVDISTDGDDWISVATGLGQPIGIDIDAIVDVEFGALYSFVRLTDAGAGDSFGSRFAGADIDAIGAISSGPAAVPAPSSGSLLAVAASGLVWFRLRRRVGIQHPPTGLVHDVKGTDRDHT